MSVKVKICGVRTPAILDAAAEAGADYVGFVFFPKSPRHIEADAARALIDRARGRVATVVVLVDPDDDLIDQIVDLVRPDILQLHGSEHPDRVAAIKARAGRVVFKAVGVSDAPDAASAALYAKTADMVLFDAKPLPTDILPGGNGVSFDWTRLRGLSLEEPFGLSGGLTADNVAEAIALTGAALVDVSSGVEHVPGEKDAVLVARFIASAKAAAPHQQAKAS